MTINASVTRRLNVPAEKAWAIIQDFGNIAWTGAENVEIIGAGIGMIRRIHIDSLPEPIDEVLDSIDPTSMTLSYSIPRGLPFPLINYKASPSVIAINEKQCDVNWLSDCEPAEGLSEEDGEKLLEGVYTQLIDWLEAALDD